MPTCPFPPLDPRPCRRRKPESRLKWTGPHPTSATASDPPHPGYFYRISTSCHMKMGRPFSYSMMGVDGVKKAGLVIICLDLCRMSKHLEYTNSRDEVEFPKELTEDWSTMEVCVDCKKFINDIVSSSKRSSVASTRSRLKRKTQSFYMSPSRSRDFRPSERTINEV